MAGPSVFEGVVPDAIRVTERPRRSRFAENSGGDLHADGSMQFDTPSSTPAEPLTCLLHLVEE